MMMKMSHRAWTALVFELCTVTVVAVLWTVGAWAQPTPAAGQAAVRSAQEEQQTQPQAPPTPSSQPPTQNPSSSPYPVAESRVPPQTPPAPSSQPPSQTPFTSQYPTREWQLPPIEVPGEPRPELREEERVGNYGQPRWTAIRRFPTTRIYVIPAGKAEFEWWLRYTFPVKNATSEREIRTYYEIGFGLGHRFQLDLYLVTQQEGHGQESALQLARGQVEIRYALADWGKIWGNPTLYLEWQHRNEGHDWIEPKILLGGAIAPGWHAGLNLVLEKELGGPDWEDEYHVTAGVSRTIVDETFHVGVEGYVEAHDVSGARFKFANTEKLFLGGPSLLIQPIPPMHVLVTPLIGKGAATGENMRTMMRLWFVTGWTF